MTNDKLIQKIRKLLALSKSPNAAEAASALAKARQLMAEYEVSMQDIAMSEVKEQAASMGQRTSPTRYMHFMAQMVAQAFSCEFYYEQVTYNRSVVKFVGIDPHAEIAGYAWDVLRRKLDAARKDFLKTVSKRFKRHNRIARADNYCWGWVAAVEKELQKLVPGTELPAIIEQYMATKALEKSEVRPARKVNTTSAAAAWDATKGYTDGSKVTLQHGMDGAVERKQIG